MSACSICVCAARGEAACARRYAEAYLSCPRSIGDRRQGRFDEGVRARYLARRR